MRNGQEIRTAVLVRDGAATHLIPGLKDLTVLKTRSRALWATCYAGGPGQFRYLLYKDVNRQIRLT